MFPHVEIVIHWVLITLNYIVSLHSKMPSPSAINILVEGLTER